MQQVEMIYLRIESDKDPTGSIPPRGIKEYSDIGLGVER